MFTWTQSSVLAAIDAGIAEVIATHNSIYTYALRHGMSVPNAYAFAMGETVKHLNTVEREVLFGLAIDAAINVDAYDAVGMTTAEYFGR